jgi:PemK-like, MazF-like toxin of type II toxin-antitoxin system
MITSAENRAWPGDHEIGPAYRQAGLPAPSRIRTTKIATIETRHADPIGKISPALLSRVTQTIALILGT